MCSNCIITKVLITAKNTLIKGVDLDEIEGYAEGIADIISALEIRVSIARSIFSIIDHHKFTRIRKYLSRDLNVEKSINELVEYVKKPERAYFVLSYVRKVILSDSVLATSMMAFIVFKVCGENRDASHEEMIIWNALGSMTDYDMRNMYYLCKDCVTAKKGDLSAEKKFDNDKIGVERRNSCNITLNLLASYGVVQKRPSTIDAGDMDDIFVPANAAQSSPEEAEVVLNLDGEYALNSVTELFYHYMCGMSQLYRDELL